MDAWYGTQVDNFLRSTSEEVSLMHLKNQAIHLGFEFYSFGMRAPVPVTNRRVIQRTNYPTAWQDRYAQKQYLASDPSVPAALRSNLLVLWSDAMFKPNKQLWHEANAFGLRVGCAQSHFDSSGVQSMLSLARSCEPLSSIEVQSISHRIQWLTLLAHHSLMRSFGPKLVPEVEFKLTSRELEVLQWTAEGKTAADISEILRISQRTVIYHLGQCSEKLGTCNKTASAVKAAMLGLIW